MPQLDEQLALPAFLVVGSILLAWYIVGNELMRRRARALAIWSKRAVDPMGGKQAVRWLTMQSFRLEVTEPQPPFKDAAIVGLVESWDVPFVWLWNRMRGRRDMVLVQLSLRKQPFLGFELFRDGSLLAGDSRAFAQQEGWREEALEELRVASPGEVGTELARRLLAELGDQRANLVRLALRRRETHLSLALNVPRPGALDPATFHRTVERLARAATSS